MQHWPWWRLAGEDVRPFNRTLCITLCDFVFPRVQAVVHEAWGALSAVTAAITDDKPMYLTQAMQILRHLGDETGGEVPGLSLPRGIEPCVLAGR